jgi:hypothetical protein
VLIISFRFAVHLKTTCGVFGLVETLSTTLSTPCLLTVLSSLLRLDSTRHAQGQVSDVPCATRQSPCCCLAFYSVNLPNSSSHLVSQHLHFCPFGPGGCPRYIFDEYQHTILYHTIPTIQTPSCPILPCVPVIPCLVCLAIVVVDCRLLIGDPR